MPKGIRLRGATGPAAPFLCPALLWCAAWLCSAAALAAGNRCGYEHIDERAHVVYVFDGDTIKLQDGRRVRLVGINTPELGHDGASDEAFAGAARDTLQQELDTSGRNVLLQYDHETHDRYGRLLAHVFLENGENVAVPLLSRGLATTLVVPPNSWGHACYQALEDSARIARHAIWGLDDYQARDSATLPPGSRGFHIVRGRVTAVRDTRRSTWIDLQGSLTLHVAHADLAYFPEHFLARLAGRDVEVRGWLRPDGKRLKMNVRDPAALTPLTREPRR